MLESLFDHTPLKVSDIEEMESEELGLMNVVRIELSIMGLIPSSSITNNQWKLKLFRWYQNIIIGIYVPVMAGQLLAMYHFWGDVDTVTDCAGIFFVFVASFFDYLYITEHEKGILHICNVLEKNPIPKVNTPKLVKKYLVIVEGCRREIRIVMEFFWGIAFIAGIKWLIYNPVMDLIVHPHILNTTSSNSDKPNSDFVFIIWFPFDATWSPLFEVIYMFQSILLAMAACHNICANSTFLTFMVHAWGKLEFVECTISSIEEEIHAERTEVNNENEDDSTKIPEDINTEVTEVLPKNDVPMGSSSETAGSSDVETILNDNSFMYPTEGISRSGLLENVNEEDSLTRVSNFKSDLKDLKNDDPLQYFVKCIKQHQAAIEFVIEVDAQFSSWLGVRMMAFQMIAIGEVFQLVVSINEWEQFLRHLLTVLVVLSQILMYCWFGQQIIQGGLDIEEAAYATPWYTYSQQYKRYLILVIMRAHRPVEVTVAHYYSLSLQSCELIIQNIYFFSMFLNQINSKEKKRRVLMESENMY